jgi:hypothetical protein
MRLNAIGMFTVLTLAAPLFADTVEMKDTGLKIEGKIHRETDDFIILLVHNETGQIRIPRNKIKNIEYDIRTQLEKIEEDDHAGRYKVAMWAIEKGMFPEAIDLLNQVKGKEGVPPEAAKLLGQAYEQRAQLDLALQNYNDYLKAKPDDKEVAARVEALAKEVGPENPAGNPDQPAKPKIVDGLEGDGTWVAEKWPNDANDCVAAITTEAGTGNKVISVTSAGGEKQKSAFSRTGQPLNLSESKEMVFKVFLNTPAPMSLALAFNNAAGEFFESKQMRITPNAWQTMSLKVDGKDFKAQKNGWQHSLPLEGKERISRIYFMIYGTRQYTLHVDSVFFK